MKLSKLLSAFALTLLLPASIALAQSGKIAGVVTDASTGDTMPGVNVVIDGTTQGAVTDADGYYFINNVRPGTYDLRASFVGFTSEVIQGVRVSTGLTTEINFGLREEAVGLEEVTVTAQRPIVQLDVSANVANLNPAEFEDLPVAGITEILDLQAGIEPGMQVRGGGLDELAFVVDGLNLRTGRSNQPFTNISFTSLEEVQVQTGGFNAEYGNVRSGIVNIATKDPSRTRYSFDGLFRIAPPQDKSLGALTGLPGGGCNYGGDVTPDCDSWFIRPGLDPAVAFEGTGNWDPYTQAQYNAFEGWNAIADRLQQEGFDVTPQDMQQNFLYTHRKDNEIVTPDYEADFTLGGPVPGISKMLGDLRFLASYRSKQTAYTLPQTRDSFTDDTYQAKLVSNVADGMKLTLSAMKGIQRGMNRNRNLPDVQPWVGNLPAYPWQGVGAEPVESLSRRGVFVFSDAGLSLADIDHTLLGAKFTHTLNASTFYEVSIQNLASKYRSGFPNLRDGSFIDEDGNFVQVPWTDNFGRPINNPPPDRLFCVGGSSDLNGDGQTLPYCEGDSPFGFLGQGGNLLTGETTGGHWNKTRDTSDVSVFTGRFDLTSQVNRFLQVKTGAELIIGNYDLNYERVNLALVGPVPEQEYPFSRDPIQGAAYAQGKLEFQGMIANVGLRLDYYDANTDWWEFDSYDTALRGKVDDLDETLSKKSVDAQVYLSPRIGISFPITENSKLYFNYGHFRQLLDPLSVFGIIQSNTGGIDVIGNPDHPMPQTVAYELGYDQNLFDQFLLRVSGFYRDIRNQPRSVRYAGLGNVVDYRTLQPWNYEDVRGFELSLNKNRGEWVRGFLNYTFLQSKSGNFGFSQFLENSFEMRNYLRTGTDYRLFSPLAEPFARASITGFTPKDWGPEVAGGHPLGDFRVNLLAEWRSGQKWVWNGGGGNFPELQENVQWRDYWNWDLRFTKYINTPVGTAQLFLDIDNVFNRKHLYQAAAFHPDDRDFDRYMWSLHLPEDTFNQLNEVDGDVDFSQRSNLPYTWIPGDDRPGDFRQRGVAFQPIEAVNTIGDVTDPNTTAWYWSRDNGRYQQWNGSSWSDVPSDQLQQVLDDKAYIDMPNFRFNTFLNPRRYTIGLRINF